MDKINLIIGNNEKKDIIKILQNYLKENKFKNNNKTIVTDIMEQEEYIENEITNYNQRTRGLIKIQDGCNNYCSYCIIPYVKGKSRSKSKEKILEEINQIVKIGIKEIVITGIHIASYGIDFKNKEFKLIDLLEEINKITDLKRIRLGSLEPKIITKEFINRLKKLEKICNHFHLSLQSGCNETLKRMNRKYTKENFENAEKLIRETYQDVAITTDIIVGFPGETDEEFDKTYNFLKKIKFNKMHIFKYSPRKGTQAIKMKTQIDRKYKKRKK